MTAGGNYGLKDEIRGYWSARAATFDESASHRIEDRYGLPEWHRLIRRAFGLGRNGRLDDLRALDIACGTGEISRVLTGLGAEVTGLDFSETMLALAGEKLAGREWTGVHADAEVMAPLPDGRFDIAVTRHLAWTLTDPAAAYSAWHRVMRPGGQLLVIDGNFRAPRGPVTRLRRWLADRIGPPAGPAGADRERHEGILERLPYGAGLVPARLRADLEAAGFGAIRALSVAPLYGRGMRGHGVAERLRQSAEHRFALVATAGDREPD